jgi:hypothetical protein
MKLTEFKQRLGAKNPQTLKKTYERDWKVGGDKPAFKAWREDGTEVGLQHKGIIHDQWPRAGIIAPANSANRYEAQVTIWKALARTAQSSGVRGHRNRLWKPKTAITTRWKIRFVPLEGWLSKYSLSKTLEVLRQESKKSTNEIEKFTSWLDFEAISPEDAEEEIRKGQLVRISANLVGWYATLMPPDDVVKIAAQLVGRNGGKGWMRCLPSQEIAEAFNALVTKPGPGTRPKDTMTLLSYRRPVEDLTREV